MTLDLSDGRKISKELLKKELSSKIRAQVIYQAICFFTLLLLL